MWKERGASRTRSNADHLACSLNYLLTKSGRLPTQGLRKMIMKILIEFKFGRLLRLFFMRIHKFRQLFNPLKEGNNKTTDKAKKNIQHNPDEHLLDFRKKNKHLSKQTRYPAKLFLTYSL